MFRKPTKVCVVCGKKFPACVPRPNGGRQKEKYCSDACRYEVVKTTARNRYYTHKDEIKARSIRWAKENRERYNFLNRRRKHTEKYRAWEREYRRRKKEANAKSS